MELCSNIWDLADFWRPGKFEYIENLGKRIDRALKWRKELWTSEMSKEEDKLDSLMIWSRATCIEMSAGKL